MSSLYRLLIFFCLRFPIAFFKKPPAERHKINLNYVFKNNCILCSNHLCSFCQRFFIT